MCIHNKIPFYKLHINKGKKVWDNGKINILTTLFWDKGKVDNLTTLMLAVVVSTQCEFHICFSSSASKICKLNFILRFLHMAWSPSHILKPVASSVVISLFCWGREIQHLWSLFLFCLCVCVRVSACFSRPPSLPSFLLPFFFLYFSLPFCFSSFLFCLCLPTFLSFSFFFSISRALSPSLPPSLLPSFLSFVE